MGLNKRHGSAVQTAHAHLARCPSEDAGLLERHWPKEQPTQTNYSWPWNCKRQVNTMASGITARNQSVHQRGKKRR
jgi:hypothetical protein